MEIEQAFKDLGSVWNRREFNCRFVVVQRIDVGGLAFDGVCQEMTYPEIYMSFGIQLSWMDKVLRIRFVVAMELAG